MIAGNEIYLVDCKKFGLVNAIASVKFCGGFVLEFWGQEWPGEDFTVP